MRVTAMLLAAGILALFAACAVADSLPPGDFSGFWIGDPGPGNSWTTPVAFGISDVQTHNGSNDGNGALDWWQPTDYNFQIVALPVTNPTPIPWNTDRLNINPSWNPLYMGTSQHFETPPPFATVGGRSSVETLYGVDQMEVYTSTPMPGQLDWINLPLAIGQWTGGWVAGSPSFVLQMQAYNRYGAQLAAGDLYFIGGSTYWGDGGIWDGRSADQIDGRAKFAGYYETQLGVSAWEADRPLPEPLTMLGVLAGVGGVGAYIRKRRMAV